MTEKTQITPVTKTGNLELKKPSELCQVLFFSDFNKKEYAQLTALQIDLSSTLFYIISDVMNKQDLSEEEIVEWSSINHFEINLQTIATLLGKYENGYYDPIVTNLQELTKIQVLTNTLHKNREREQILFHLIRKISWTQDKKTTTKRVKVWVEPELLMMFHNVNKMYTSFYLQVQYGLNSKYSKLLYEVLKDYIQLGEITIEYSTLKALMNIDVVEKPEWDKWSTFNRDILKRAVHELTEKSDIKVSYEPIKERRIKKLEVTKIKFICERQKSILIDYERKNSVLDTDTYVISDNSNSTPVDEYESKLRSIAYQRMEEAKMFGSVIQHETNYIDTVVQKLKTEDIDVKSMIEIDKILDEVKTEYIKHNGVVNGVNKLITLNLYDTNYLVVSISSDYLLYSPVDKVNITKTVADTINMIKQFKSRGGEFKVIETPGYVTVLGISYI